MTRDRTGEGKKRNLPSLNEDEDAPSTWEVSRRRRPAYRKIKGRLHQSSSDRNIECLLEIPVPLPPSTPIPFPALRSFCPAPIGVSASRYFSIAAMPTNGRLNWSSGGPILQCHRNCRDVDATRSDRSINKRTGTSRLIGVRYADRYANKTRAG